MALMVKNPSVNAGDMRCRFSLWVGKVPWKDNGNPLQYSCLENPMGRGSWRTTVHCVTKSSDEAHILNIFIRLN